MPQMRRVVDVVNRGRDEKGPVGGHDCLQTPDMGPGRCRSSRRRAAVLSRKFLNGKERAEDGLLAIEVEPIGVGEVTADPVA